MFFKQFGSQSTHKTQKLNMRPQSCWTVACDSHLRCCLWLCFSSSGWFQLVTRLIDFSNCCEQIQCKKQKQYNKHIECCENDQTCFKHVMRFRRFNTRCLYLIQGLHDVCTMARRWKQLWKNKQPGNRLSVIKNSSEPCSWLTKRQIFIFFWIFDVKHFDFDGWNDLAGQNGFQNPIISGRNKCKTVTHAKTKKSKLSTIFGHGFSSVNLVETVEPEQSKGELMHFDVFV